MLNIHIDNRSLRDIAMTENSAKHTAVSARNRNTATRSGHTGVYIRPNKIYGHIHMAKTGGSSLNGILASTYENICGNKGYSYNFYQVNARWTAQKLRKPGEGYVMSRKRMNEIGYEDCDYISEEKKMEFWSEFNNFHDTPMELHVPCRSPIDHLMSQCNHRQLKIDCDGTETELFKSVDKCLMILHRFDLKVAKKIKATLKCYDFKKQFTVYMEYLSKKLLRRRIVITPTKRETNLPRDRDNECIWKRNDLMKQVENYLLSQESYYKFCSQCLGSENDITHVQAQGNNI